MFFGYITLQVDKLYAGLKDLTNERRNKLEETLKLYMLNREVDDLEQWIAEREVVAGSHELGQDFEHVSVSLQGFNFSISFELFRIWCFVGSGLEIILTVVGLE